MMKNRWWLLFLVTLLLKAAIIGCINDCTNSSVGTSAHEDNRPDSALLRSPSAKINLPDFSYATRFEPFFIELEASDPDSPAWTLHVYLSSSLDGELVNEHAPPDGKIVYDGSKMSVGIHELSLTVTDPTGLSDIDCATVHMLPWNLFGTVGRDANITIGIGAEDEPSIYTEDVIARLAAQPEVELILKTKESKIKNADPAFIELVRRLNKAGIPLRAWFLLDDSIEDGLYLYDSNVEQFLDMLHKFLAWKSSHNLFFVGIALDVELPTWIIERILGISTWPPDIDLLFSLYDPVLHAAAAQTFSLLLEEAKAAGFSTYAVSYFSFLDDSIDGDDSLQAMLALPGLLPNNPKVDILSTMLYRPNAESVGLDLGSYFVYSYASTMAQNFGPRGAITLKFWPAEDDPYLLRIIEDALLVKNLGLERVEFYSLHAFLNEYGSSSIETICDGVSEVRDVIVERNALTSLVRQSLATVDNILE